jgi:preprotein translocase subunit SecF
MIRVLANANYDFIGLRRAAYVLSAILTVPGLLLMLVAGLNYSIEFTGGTLVQVTMLRPGVDAAQLRASVTEGGLSGAEIQNFGSEREFVIRARLGLTGPATEAEAQRTADQVRAALTRSFGDDAFRVERREAVGPKVGGELRQKATIAILLSFLATLVYLAFRFEWRFGVAAVVATGHDILATIAFTRYLNLEVSLVVVSAVLTVIGYSLNDTIVIFDRVRENLHKYKRDDFVGILNRSINETLPRTVLTGGATLAALLTMLLLAGEVIRPFAWVMLFGVIIGTFSSIYIASPVLLAIERRWPGHEARGVKARVAPAGTGVPLPPPSPPVPAERRVPSA